MERQLFQLKFFTKQLQSQAKRCSKSAAREQNKIKLAVQKGEIDAARVYAEAALRQKSQSTTYLRLSSRVEAVAMRVEAAMRMHQVTRSMAGIVCGLEQALQRMDTAQVSAIMAKFEAQFEDIEVSTTTMDQAMDKSVASTAPPERVDAMIQEVADRHGLEVSEMLASSGTAVPTARPVVATSAVPAEDELAARVRQLMATF